MNPDACIEFPEKTQAIRQDDEGDVIELPAGQQGTFKFHSRRGCVVEIDGCTGLWLVPASAMRELPVAHTGD